MLVQEETSGGRGAKVLYADEAYFSYRTAYEYKVLLKTIEAQKEEAYARYLKELDEISQKEQKYVDYIAKVSKELGKEVL